MRKLSPCRVDLIEEIANVEAAVAGCEGAETARGLLELALAPDLPSPAALVPGDRDMNKTLEEVALALVRRSPGLLQRLVSQEILLCRQQRETPLVRVPDSRFSLL